MVGSRWAASFILVVAAATMSSASPVVQVGSASAAGASLNSNLMTGGGRDDTAVLQYILDGARESRPVHLIIDGPALVSGLNVYGNTTVECLEGAGLYLKDGSNRAIIRNAHRSREAVTDEHISIRGCILNGNREHQSASNQEEDGTFISGLQFLGTNHLDIRDVALYDIRSFGIWVANGRFIQIRNVLVDNGSPPYPESSTPASQYAHIMQYAQSDGIHFNGPIGYLTVDGLNAVNIGDDALALNANDMLGDDITAQNEMGPYVGQGPITDVTIRNIVLGEALGGIRLLSRDQRIDRVAIENVSGKARSRMLTLGPFVSTKNTGNFGAITVDTVTVQTSKIAPYREIFKAMTIRFPEEEEYPLFAVNSPIESLILKNIVVKTSDGRPVIWIGPNADVQALSADLHLIDPGLQSMPVRLLNGGHIATLNLQLDWTGHPVDVGRTPIDNEGAAIDQLHWVYTPPSYVAAEVRGKDLIVTFSEEVEATDFASGVSVTINGHRIVVHNPRRLFRRDRVRYELSRSVSPNDIITWGYDAADGNIQNANGDRLLTVSAKRATNR